MMSRPEVDTTMATLDVTGDTMHMPAANTASDGLVAHQSWLARRRIAGWVARLAWLACLLFSLYVFIITGPSRYRQVTDLYTLNNTAFEQLGFSHYTLP